MMPTSQMWSYTKSHIGILCHDEAFRCRYVIETFSISHIQLL
ncbi:hypothetical protein F383_09605 [Gossypium arboreum]|uniref:Uncharacterized protein n=1 Tax=Gossypium arboreum TaxID=29729 RepID=A0A0B0PJV3_GOSAR|nr:hypothetical protein F383_09605 [Gossypium arboreum]